LFQHAGLLADVLSIYPDSKIILSTSWVLRYGFSATAKRLPDSLLKRCIGATFHSRNMDQGQFQLMPRGEQVIDDVKRRKPAAWVSLDDNYEGWPPTASWVKTDPYEGISTKEVLNNLHARLHEMHR
jgi:hypothetical protein